MDVVWQRAVTRGLPALVAVLAALLLSDALFAATPDRLQVRSIGITEQGPATRVELRLTRAATYNLFTLSDPNRVVIDISGAALGPAALPLPSAVGAIRQVRVAPRILDGFGTGTGTRRATASCCPATGESSRCGRGRGCRAWGP